MTLQTVADKVGVSRMTVSNAFSRPDQLSAGLRTQILAAAAELGYVGPDPAARALARRSVGAVGVVLTDSLGEAFLDPVASAFFGALADELAPTGMALSLVPADAVGGRVPARDLALDAAVIYACAGDTDAVEWLSRRCLPLVFVDQAPLPGSAAVLLDERSGGRLAVEHLAGLGHRDIVVLTMNSDRDEPGWARDPHRVGSNHVSRVRTAGAVEAIEEAGLTARVYEVYDNRDRYVADGAAAILGDPHRPTAVVCFSDLMAAGVVRAAEESGLRVPDDLSVVGFDDSVLARAVRPALTTLRQDFVAKGRAAAHALTEALTAARATTGTSPAEPGEPATVTIPVQLVVRESTGPAPSGSG
ncbi:LacI family DNA-binding transcriptional regulator [Actinotalea sp. K2]|uniref:LacI family DNA-binding transcriptional regulator n=1 Tax=Actinotalea sp. K2 TaxID=2939438 RepID=UPI0020180AAE|nr:LacI family DNA-binding transcriptional regulator [Actinotalea sp. K2]MCL3862504.1 LacI family DNA-binding transcriptional regulator [Actinotalea sp. K2]